MPGSVRTFPKRKIIYASAAAAAVVAALAVAGSVETKRPVQQDGLPKAAQIFIATHCPGETPALALREYDDFRRSYEVTLVDGTKMRFSRNGEWKSFESHARPVPAALVPPQIAGYLDTNFLYDIDSRYINMPARTRPPASTFVNPVARPGAFAPRATSSPAKKAEVIRPQPAPRRLTPVRETAASARTAPSVPCAYAPGDTVLHTIFGRGTVSKIEGSGDSTKATIEFDSHGTKQLLLKFARLKKL